MIVDYKHLFDTAKISAGKQSELNLIAKRINEGKKRYEEVAAALKNNIPWWFIGITHFMEAGAYYPKHFNYHLHCGDPLTGRTIHVPKGRPKANPGGGSLPPSSKNPYSWNESAVDAMLYMRYHEKKIWDMGSCLFLFEKYNGMGYAKRGMLSPYLWNYTNYYVRGKYVRDNIFDPTAISKQPGVAAILKTLLVV